MEKGWLQKQIWIIIALVACVCIFALAHYDSVLDTEKVSVDKRLYHVGVLLDSSIMDGAGIRLITRAFWLPPGSWGCRFTTRIM